VTRLGRPPSARKELRALLTEMFDDGTRNAAAHEFSKARQYLVWLAGRPRPLPPGPFAAMLTELAANRVNMNTAANPGCQWLFPGQRVGQPLMPIGLCRQLHELGIPLTQARTAAFRQLVLQAPPPVVARSLGFDYGTATEHAIAAGGTWNRYPAARRDSTLAPLHPSRGGAP
jgi:hypothetical protein